ncbi:hypothetical protein Ahy_A08g038440 isoform F [Arachis hypogaea]|uniref:Uncharacterized protein n=1 Tax=Arachis hypogaea TaxID=3818 RepID=A0A445BTE9_ARAHY|nr:hypothetical protein Ahy_A08g038440 isoform F [Arachis hypogaea]
MVSFTITTISTNHTPIIFHHHRQHTTSKTSTYPKTVSQSIPTSVCFTYSVNLAKLRSIRGEPYSTLANSSAISSSPIVAGLGPWFSCSWFCFCFDTLLSLLLRLPTDYG